MERYLEYITSGLNIKWKRKQLLFQKLSTIIAALIFGLFPGVILRSYWLVIGVLMVAISAISSMASFVLLKKKIIFRTYLVFQVILYADWILQFILCQISFYTMRYGFNGYVLLILLPLFLPLCIGKINAVKLRNGSYKKNNATGVIFVGSFSSVGIIGMFLAKLYLKNISQDFAILFLLFCFSIVTALFSIGLLSIQKLYYLSKIEQSQDKILDIYVNLD